MAVEDNKKLVMARKAQVPIFADETWRLCFMEQSEVVGVLWTMNLSRDPEQQANAHYQLPFATLPIVSISPPQISAQLLRRIKPTIRLGAHRDGMHIPNPPPLHLELMTVR
jgi:hypothetical protein